ncbi:MAG TPA: hypothetical protein PKW98_18550, partial [Candidatus Wallbacteria bacterium]|nr:hypothetical protein [Candidatus Wallbacteria bacterium]
MSDIINENKIYPIIFSRKIKSTIWGGRRLYSGRDPENGRLGSCPKIGEIWSLCENHNIVALNGPYKLFMLEDILKDVPVGFLGGPFQNNHFPLIMKIIDAD